VQRPGAQDLVAILSRKRPPITIAPRNFTEPTGRKWVTRKPKIIRSLARWLLLFWRKFV